MPSEGPGPQVESPARRARPPGLTPWLWGLLAAAIAGTWAAWGWQQAGVHPARPAAAQRPSRLGQFGAAPEFHLTDQSGRPFDSEILRGRVWIADFIFTSCRGTCPPMTRRMASLQEQLPASVLFVSFTVDPATDSPQVLEAYGQGYGADFERWRFLTGDWQALKRLAGDGFSLSVAEGGGPSEPITHSVRFVLVDGEGIIRGYYDSTEPEEIQTLIADTRSLLKLRDGSSQPPAE